MCWNRVSNASWLDRLHSNDNVDILDICKQAVYLES